MRSSRPLAVTRTPVRWGRVSSREAARATRAIVSTNAWVGTVSTPVVGRLGQLREVLLGKRAQVEARLAGRDLDVLLRAAVLERDLVLGQRAGHVEQQAPGDNRLARGRRVRLERDAQAKLHVGRLQLGGALLYADEHAGKGLDGAAGGSRADGHAEAGEERFTGNGELQDLPN